MTSNMMRTPRRILNSPEEVLPWITKIHETILQIIPALRKNSHDDIAEIAADIALDTGLLIKWLRDAGNDEGTWTTKVRSNDALKKKIAGIPEMADRIKAGIIMLVSVGHNDFQDALQSFKAMKGIRVVTKEEVDQVRLLNNAPDATKSAYFATNELHFWTKHLGHMLACEEVEYPESGGIVAKGSNIDIIESLKKVSENVIGRKPG